MSDRPITNHYLKLSADYMRDFNRTFPEDNINYFLDAEYESSDAEAKIINYVTKVPGKMINKVGSAHGGYIAAISDELMGNAVHYYGVSKDPSFAVTTINMTFNCVKPLFENDEIKIKVIVRHLGKRTASATCEIYKGDVLCSYSSESFAVINSDKIPPVVISTEEALAQEESR